MALADPLKPRLVATGDGRGVGAGAAEIDLRYLGSRRTLVLVDGLRFVSGASASDIR